MKKSLLFQTVLVLSLFGFGTAFAQTPDFLSQAYKFIEKKYELTYKSIGDLRIKSQYHTDHNNVDHVFLVQTFDGIEILGSGINIAFRNNIPVSSTGHHLLMLDQFPVTRIQPSVTASEAIQVAAGSLGLPTRSVSTFKRTTPSGVPVYDKAEISLQDIPVQLGYLFSATDGYRLVYTMQIAPTDHSDFYQSVVDASTGIVVANDNMTLHCSFDHGYMSHEATCMDQEATLTSLPPVTLGANGTYRALPVSIESPNHGNFELLTDVNDPTASPLGWHDADGVAGPDYTETRGNNVHSFLDRDYDDLPDTIIDGGASLIFDFPFNENAEPIGNKAISVTNLFYWNNILHDFTYQYGFNEVAGNFQNHNYSGQGAGEDFVNAEAQFGDNDPADCGDCLNNANFSTPVDGFSGRMRMYTWDRDNSSKFLDVIEPAELSGKILTGDADFGPDITSTPITGEVIVINDGTFQGSKGCNPITTQPELAGKVALIDRGICDFSLKVYNAQEAGAIGAIICNFEDATIGMGAGDNAGDVTIPSVFISSVECERIRIAAGKGLVVSFVAPATGGPTKRDGCIDNSVIAHEYGHGISTRLTGGPDNSSCLSPNAIIGAAEESHGMGEGWSDFFALVTTVQPGDAGEKRRGIGTYANKEETNGRGIRTYPYSTDMSINPHTYDDILLEAVPHGVGSVWCAMIWDLYWAFSDAYGWDPDLYHGTGGNNIAIQLVMDGLKLQDCNPGFINSRDAILEADMLNNGGANQCLIWSVFARRGLGADAVGGDPDSRSDGKEGFALPNSCLDNITFSKDMTPEIVAGDNIEVTLKVVNYKSFTLNNVFIEDPIPDGCTYLPGSANIEPTTGNSLVWSIPTLDPDEELTITYLLKSDPAKNSVQMLFDDIEGVPEDRWDIYYDSEGTTDNFWQTQSAIVHSGVAAWNVGDVETESEHFLQNYEHYTITGNYPVYRFYHYYNTETGADGGFIEITTDNGQSWYTMNSQLFRNGYPRRLQYGTFAIPNLDAFSGLSSPDFTMTPTYIDLSEYIGQDVKIRYRFGTDANTPGDGWYVDDVEIMDAVLYNSEACISSDESDPICAEAPSRGTIVDSQIFISTDDNNSKETFALMPNPAVDIIQVVMSAEKSIDAVVTIYNLTGHQVGSYSWNLAEGINQKSLDISRYSPGMYVMQVNTGTGMKSEKFIKE